MLFLNRLLVQVKGMPTAESMKEIKHNHLKEICILHSSDDTRDKKKLFNGLTSYTH